MPKPQMGPDEHEIKTFRANRSQGSRAVGGHLVLTNHRLVFYPHELDDAIGGDSWECSLDSIESVGIADRGRNLFDGSIRRRLEVDAGGPHQFFVVSKVVEPVGSMRLTAAVLRVISGEETHTRKFRWGAFHMECRRHTVPTSHGGPIGER